MTTVRNVLIYEALEKNKEYKEELKKKAIGHGLSLNTIYNMDCIEGMKLIPDNSIDSIVTDPPYEIGFMGKGWDSTGIANNIDMWRECFRVLKPGGHLLSFAATRTYHRMTCAIEDAGFEVRDMIEWVYGSGFPKSRNIGKDIEKKEVGGIKNLKQIGTKQGIKVETGTQGFSYSKEYVAGKSMGGRQISGEIPVYEINNSWGGWGTALKPAHEPICMARKPLAEKTVAENCLKWGTGGINIDESRVEGTYENEGRNIRQEDYKSEAEFLTALSKEGRKTRSDSNPQGRFPANLILSDCEEVRECFPDTGKGNGKGSYNYAGREYDNKDTSMFNGDKPQAPSNFNDSGNASRFFKSIIYQAKASKSERCNGNNHPTVKPIALMEYLIKMVTKEGGTVLDPFTGSGTTLVAAKKNGYEYIGFELDEGYRNIANKRIQDRLSDNTLFS